MCGPFNVDSAMSEVMHTLNVELGERSYPIYIGRDLLADATLLRQHLANRVRRVMTGHIHVMQHRHNGLCDGSGSQG